MARVKVIRLQIDISKVWDLEERRESLHLSVDTSCYIDKKGTRPDREYRLLIDEGKSR